MRIIIFSLILLVQFACLPAQNNLPFEEIIYGRKHGVAFTMLQLKPTTNSNGRCIIMVIAGGWNSSYEMATGTVDEMKDLYCNKGYNVFEVIVGSQQLYAMPDQVDQVKQAVRYIRFNAKKLGIDADHIGITGYSAGGHLELTVALADNIIDTSSKDPIDKVSARVQAAAVLFPPTNLIEWSEGFSLVNPIDEFHRESGIFGAIDFKQWVDSSKTYDPVSDPETRNKIGKSISPFYEVSADDPPVFIIHGNADKVVPLQQTEAIVAKFKQAEVINKLIIKAGAGHSIEEMYPEVKQFVEWFDKYLK